MKVYLIGANGTLGNAISSVFNKSNIKVVAVGRNKGNESEFHYCDLSKLDGISSQIYHISDIKEDDIVIINSGVLGSVSKVTTVDLEEFVSVLNINAISNIALFRSFYKAGIKKYIVISSGAANKKYSGWANYCLSKTLQKDIWQTISADAEDVSVSLIAPGVLNSKMHGFVDNVDPKDFPDLSKFFEIRRNNEYQDEYESAEKLLKLILEEGKPKDPFEFIDLRLV